MNSVLCDNDVILWLDGRPYTIKILLQIFDAFRNKTGVELSVPNILAIPGRELDPRYYKQDQITFPVTGSQDISVTVTCCAPASHSSRMFEEKADGR